MYRGTGSPGTKCVQDQMSRSLHMLTCQFFYPGSFLVMTLKPFLSPFMLRCPPLWHLGKLRGTSYLPRGHFSNMLVSAMQRLFFDVKLATPTQISSLWCKKECLNLHSTVEFWILIWYPNVKTLSTSEYFSHCIVESSNARH